MRGFAFISKLLWMTLLLWASYGRSTDAALRAVVSMNTSWRIPEGETVVFHCEGPNKTSGNYTRWLYNNKNTSVHTPNFFITSATTEKSGEYRCQIGDSAFSDPIYLGVYRAPSRIVKGDTSKSLLSLHPPWNRIFVGENVTLHCVGSGFSGNSKTQWFHKGTKLQVQNSSFSITSANISDSGEYKCQSGDSSFSDPMYLGVYKDWLLLQASLALITEGEPLVLSCHGWRNRAVYKVTFYHNNRSLKYWYDNHNFSIPHATIHNRGVYHCTGILWRIHYTSKPVFIDFKGTLNHMQYLFPMLTGILFAVDSALLVLTQKQLHYISEKKRILALKCSPRATPDADPESKIKTSDETDVRADPDPQPDPSPDPDAILLDT